MDHLPELAEVYAVVDASRALGAERLDDGTQLVGRVPHIAPQAWLHILFSGLAPREIEQLERDVVRPLGPSFSRFLSYHNGLSLFADALSIYGLRKSNRRSDMTDWQPYSIRVPNTLERPRDAAEEYIFVGGYSSDGSLLYIDARDGCTYRCARHSAEPVNAWPGFFAMLSSEASRIARLFDRDGKRLRPTLVTTPPTSSADRSGG